MKRLGIFLLFVILIKISSSLSVNFSCPEEISQNQELVCNISLSDSQDNYDLKLDFFGNGNRISKIWDSSQWKSSNYYLIGFIKQKETKEIRLTLNFSGNAEGILKLRKTNKTSIDYQQNITIKIIGNANTEENNLEIEEENPSEEAIDNEETIQDNQSKTNLQIDNVTTESLIKLGSDRNFEQEIYISKNEKIKENLLFGFCIFLILVIVILLIRR